MIKYNQLIRHSGNINLFQVIEMAIVAHTNGYPIHFHVEGLRGTGKTTIIRSAQQIFPKIERIKGCIYNCDPGKPHCPQHFACSKEQVISIGTELIPMPFLEISHSAKIGTVVGSIDLAKLAKTSNSEAALLPGIIPRANRGIIFIDEINRLADTSPELVDVLLDVMGTRPGRIQIEESGLETVNMSVLVSVWAASNPDEEPGQLEEIRRQLADRFDYTVQMGRPKEIFIITKMLENNSWNNRLQRNFDEGIVATNNQCRKRLQKQIEHFPTVKTGQIIREKLAKLYLDYDFESLRTIEALQIGGQILASLKLKANTEIEDLKPLLSMALTHRVDPIVLNKLIKEFESSQEDIQKTLKLSDTQISKVNNKKKKRNRTRFMLMKRIYSYLEQFRIWLLATNLIKRIVPSFRQNKKTYADNSIPSEQTNQCKTAKQMAFLNPLDLEVKEFSVSAASLEQLNEGLVATAEDLIKESRDYLNTGEV